MTMENVAILYLKLCIKKKWLFNFKKLFFFFLKKNPPLCFLVFLIRNSKPILP